MKNQQGYNSWAATYDTVINKTRDLEARALRDVLADIPISRALELGCGTGKNTSWLAEKVASLTSVDFSEEMLNKAKEKVRAAQVNFKQADLTKPWNFVEAPVDLITFSLVLEHIEDLDNIFTQASSVLKPGGALYICELHPFKQYKGSKARFETDEGTFVLDCFTHHISDYITPALKYGLSCDHLAEWFDEDDRNGIPRLVSFLFRK
ncbi:Methyltransferase type 11 [Fulvivirga imtechensis AK7]|uniref:Methyltransferase type 11 n=1 Tax=Fulvivirga imtechensis AK7 TaxID=1237149 RepID=L8JP75_9BACT|nr:class I SAM-dependent methyltransferase [Fulvivirga imtechensis]ELR70645.1 Methyltransferase type 11 [Fulvivirga imtechensis AK7]